MWNIINWSIIGTVFLSLGFQVTGKEAPSFKTLIITSKVNYIVDGDSLYLHGYKPQIRLWGVDAPEKGERGFTKAKNQLKQYASSEELSCEKVDQDKYGRTVARCYLANGEEINRLMIDSGKAAEYKYFTKGFYSKK
jgi:micrococcal nuclease